MNHFKLVACLASLAMFAACTQSQDTDDQAAADAAMAESDDGGIPLSAASEAAMAIYAEVRELADRADFIEANQAARRLTAEAPDFAGAWIMLGNTSLSGEQFARATSEAVKLAANGTKGEQLWAAINMSFIENNADERLRLGQELVETFPDSPRAWVIYSGSLTTMNMHEEARQAGARAVALAPEQAFPHTNLGFLYLNNDPRDFDAAMQHFTHAVEIAPDEDNYRINIGDVNRAMGNLETARDDYSAALELDETNDIAAIKRAHVNSFLGNYDEARADYDLGIAQERELNQSSLAVYRAFVNLHAGDSEAAVAELWDELDKIDTYSMPADQKLSTRIFVLTNIADICMHKDMDDEAANAVYQLTAALSESGLNSGDENFARLQKVAATMWQGRLAAYQDNYETASARAEEMAALVADDDNPRKLENYHELLGLIALRQGDYATAVEHLRQADLSTAPNGGDVRNIYLLATALAGVGESDEANGLMNQVANWNFNSAWFAMLKNGASEA